MLFFNLKNRFSYEKAKIFNASFFLSFFLNAQTNPSCGTESTSSTTYSQFLQNINFNPYSTVTAYSSFTYQIPLNVIIVAEDNGDFPSGAAQKIYDDIENANNFFTNGMSFYICNIEVFNNSTFYGLDTHSEALSLYSTNNVDDAINLYYCDIKTGPGNIYGFASLPYQAQNNRIYMDYFIPSYHRKHVLAHELGHYFGLRHTHLCWEYSANDPNCPAELVNGSNSATAGDFIIDTKASTLACSQITCPIDCSGSTDSNGDAYDPDDDNIMSYFWKCNPYTFTPKQMELTLNTLQNHPQRTFLINTNPTCDYSPVSNQGLVEVVKDYNGGTKPLDNQPIDIAVIGGTTCQESTLLNDLYYVNGGCGVLGQYGNQNIDVLVSPLTNSPATSHDYDVTTFDIVLFRNHILGNQYLGSPYKIIAGDVNNDKKLSTLDLLLIKKVILEIDDEFTAGSWRFVPTYYLDSDPNFVNIFLQEEEGPFIAVWNNQKDYYGYMDEIQINLSNPQLPKMKILGRSKLLR